MTAQGNKRSLTSPGHSASSVGGCQWCVMPMSELIYFEVLILAHLTLEAYFVSQSFQTFPRWLTLVALRVLYSQCHQNSLWMMWCMFPCERDPCNRLRCWPIGVHSPLA